VRSSFGARCGDIETEMTSPNIKADGHAVAGPGGGFRLDEPREFAH